MKQAVNYLVWLPGIEDNPIIFVAMFHDSRLQFMVQAGSEIQMEVLHARFFVEEIRGATARVSLVCGSDELQGEFMRIVNQGSGWMFGMTYDPNQHHWYEVPTIIEQERAAEEQFLSHVFSGLRKRGNPR